MYLFTISGFSNFSPNSLRLFKSNKSTYFNNSIQQRTGSAIESVFPSFENSQGPVQRRSAPKSREEQALLVDPEEIKIHSSPTPPVASTIFKYSSLIILVVQSSANVILMRYTRSQPNPTSKMYLASTAVFLSELLKLTTCILATLSQNHFNVPRTLAVLSRQVRHPDTLRMVVPAAIYTIQSQLLYLALSNLNSGTFQVLYQSKTLTTALFAVVLMGKRLSVGKWMALLLLTLGVALVQLGPGKAGAGMGGAGHAAVGFGAVAAAALSSGFAGVYFERSMKSATGKAAGGSPPTVWCRNIQLGLFGTFFSFVAMWITDHRAIFASGLFQGYTPLTCVVISSQALGGLLVAVVVKYADNILKSFATAVSIIVSAAIEAAVWGVQPKPEFVVGATVVVFAVMMYGLV
ncbi:UDP-N-acetylglucosamine transporter-like protein [Cladochytrium replicatum]|nr:UDP-N-acetylglucosamine transporter-like protein [Cladochytrium replicatum]